MNRSISYRGLAATASLFLLTSAHAADNEVSAAEEKMATQWAQSVDTNKDHLVSRAEVLAIVERAFAAADAKKTGNLDMKQLAKMLREFDPRAVGVRSTLAKP